MFAKSQCEIEIMLSINQLWSFSSFIRGSPVIFRSFASKTTKQPSSIGNNKGVRLKSIFEIEKPNVVIGLSKAVLKVPKETVGPGASSEAAYKNPEYYCYNVNSYYEAEVELQKYRGPVPDCNVPWTASNK